MTAKLQSALTEALDCTKSVGLIRKYSLIWNCRSEAPRIVWKATDSSEEALRRSVAQTRWPVLQPNLRSLSASIDGVPCLAGPGTQSFSSDNLFFP
jgi:hypothetical protein